MARILAAGINAAQPDAAIAHAVIREGDVILICGNRYRLTDYERIVVISVGKAAGGMATALFEKIGDRINDLLLITKPGLSISASGNRFEIIEAGHPIPNHESLRAGQRAQALASGLTQNDLLICLISGGGSSLMVFPGKGISLSEYQGLTESLLRSGASIEEFNIVRRALDQLKGGGLASASNGATIVGLIISDVVGDPLEAIASGPTVQNPTTAKDAIAILNKFGLLTDCPPAISRTIQQQAKEVIPLVKHVRIHNHVIANNSDAITASIHQARKEGFLSQELGSDLRGEAREMGTILAARLQRSSREKRPFSPPNCLIAGGETTVTVKGTGRGGRNTELALAASIQLNEVANVLLVSLATDGEDGSTDAAGAVVTGQTLYLAKKVGMEPLDFLARNDSYPFFAKLDDLIKTGPTGTNVNDLAFLFAF